MPTQGEPNPDVRYRTRFLTLVFLLVALTVLDTAWPRLAGVAEPSALAGVWQQVYRIISVAWWLVLATCLILAVEVFVWRGLEQRKVAVPKLLVDVARALVFVIAIFGVISAIFDQTVTGLLATSGVIAIVLGFALQSTLSDLFSGIALNLERPFRVGDWVRLDTGTVGQIVQTNWRATRLRPNDGNEITVPNSKMAGAQLTNFSMPRRDMRQTLKISVPSDVPPRRVQDILVAAALRCARVATAPRPQARLTEFQDGKIALELDYWIVNYHDLEDVRDEISCEIWRCLDVVGIALSGTASPPMSGAEEASRRERLLQHVDPFRRLDAAHRATIAQHMGRIDLAAGEIVVREGERSDCLYIVGEGLLEVSVDAPGPGRRIIARLAAAQIFGEIALLTGQPRTATVAAVLPGVVYSIAKEDISEAVRANPRLAADLEALLASRRTAADALSRTLIDADRAHPDDETNADLFAKFRAFFGLS